MREWKVGDDPFGVTCRHSHKDHGPCWSCLRARTHANAEALRARVEELTAERDRLAARVAEDEAAFDLYRAAVARGTKNWHRWHPEKVNTLPDLAALIDGMCARVEKLEAWAAKVEAVRVAAETMVAIFREMAPDDRFAPPRTPERNRELLEWVRDRRDRLDAATRKVGTALSSCPPLGSVTGKEAER